MLPPTISSRHHLKLGFGIIHLPVQRHVIVPQRQSDDVGAGKPSFHPPHTPHAHSLLQMVRKRRHVQERRHRSLAERPDTIFTSRSVLNVSITHSASASAADDAAAPPHTPR